ncbi:MAG: hypothetical protein ACHQZR_09610 [Candidatus Limnocylindrales bacterium]
MIAANRHQPTQSAPPAAHEDLNLYRHPIVDDVSSITHARWREASQQRLAASAQRAAVRHGSTRPSGLRPRLGAWLVQAGYSLGAPRPEIKRSRAIVASSPDGRR